jgi:DNA-binding HxlR family transcriptional regulator
VESDEVQFCPVGATLALLNERWTLHIIHTLAGGKRRFNELSRAYHINPRTLSDRLRALEVEGIVARTVVQTMPPYVEYELTEKGRGLICIMEALSDWGRHWMKAPQPSVE